MGSSNASVTASTTRERRGGLDDAGAGRLLVCLLGGLVGHAASSSSATSRTTARRTLSGFTIVVLATNQMLPQLRAHADAALNVGVTPVELREAVYQCAPFIGFPAALNALGVINEVFRSRGIDVPLSAQATTDDADRFKRGHAIQHPIYGDEIKDNLADLPQNFRDLVPRLLTQFCFGDFYTRTGLDLALRELLVLCLLAALGGTEAQLQAHTLGNQKVGNNKDTQLAALLHALPYIGFPRALNAIRVVKTSNA
jgi:4-carboxymuconolactone decarboxylase